MTSFLTSTLGDYLGDAVAAAVGIEPTDAEFCERAEAAFKRADADGSGALDFDETYAACKAVPGLKHLSEARARDIFERLDEDGSGSLDANAFGKLAASLRSAHALDQMPGVIYCGGRLMNPSRNPAAAEAARLKELYSKPYRPRSVLAKAIARPTTRRRTIHGGEDLDRFDASSKSGQSDRRARGAALGYGSDAAPSWSVGALETLYALLLAFRLACAVLGTAYIHPDEYHQSVEIGARDVLSVAASPRAWEFDAAAEDAAPARSAIGHVLAAGASFRVWRFLARFDRNIAYVARAMLAGAAGGCEQAALARGLAAGLREVAARVGGGEEASSFGAPGSGDGERLATDFADLRVSPTVLFLAPRVFAFCASLVVDLAASRAARGAYWAQSRAGRAPGDARRVSEKSHSDAARAGLRARLFVASSWPAVTLLVRPFTNAVECVLVAALLCLACAPPHVPGDEAHDARDLAFERSLETTPRRVADASDAKSAVARLSRARRRAASRAALFAGAVTAVGTWTRFTFPLFAAPLGAALVARAARASAGSAATAARGALSACAAGVLGFAAVASLLVVVDTAYFKGGDAVARVFFGRLHDTPGFGRRAVLEATLASARHVANDALATARAWFRDPRLPPLDAISSAWRETSVAVAATRGAAARFAARCAAAPWVVTPYNAFAYNADTTNLAAHGLHPRFTHALLNFPALFGPMAFFAYRAFVRAVAGAAKGRTGRDDRNDRNDREDREDREGREEEDAKPRVPATDAVASSNATRAALLCVLALPLIGLSLAPHQEPRFLLPALPAAAALAAAEGATASLASSPAALAAWSATNLLGACFFGFAHQGGVVPAVAHVATVLAEDDTAELAPVYFWRTYTPPESLMAFPAAAPPPPEPASGAAAGLRRKNGSPGRDAPVAPVSPSRVVDLRGASVDGVLAAFAAREDRSRFYVVAPATAAAELRARLATGNGGAVSETWRRDAHFSGEELRGYHDAFARGGLRALWDAMSLGVYAVER